MSKKSLVKFIAIITLTSVIIAGLLGLGLLFGIISFDTFWVGRVLLTCLTLVVAGILAFNSVNAITSGNKAGLIAGLLITVSAALFLTLIWAVNALGDFYETYLKIVVIVSAITVFFNVLVANYVRLKNSIIAVQVIFYLLFAYIITAIIFAVLGNTALIEVEEWMVFGAAIIIDLTLYVILVVKGKTLSQKDTEIKFAEGYVSIPKTEYEEMKAEIQRLKAIIENKGE